VKDEDEKTIDVNNLTGSTIVYNHDTIFEQIGLKNEISEYRNEK